MITLRSKNTATNKANKEYIAKLNSLNSGFTFELRESKSYFGGSWTRKYNLKILGDRVELMIYLRSAGKESIEIEPIVLDRIKSYSNKMAQNVYTSISILLDKDKLENAIPITDKTIKNVKV